jgi:hypothetical protein
MYATECRSWWNLREALHEAGPDSWQVDRVGGLNVSPAGGLIGWEGTCGSSWQFDWVGGLDVRHGVPQLMELSEARLRDRAGHVVLAV